MAYKDINVSKLESALKSLDDINNKSLSDLKGKISSSDWGGNVRGKVTDALGVLAKEYDDLSKDIEKFKNIKDKIKKYQHTKKDCDDYEADKSKYWGKYEYYKKKYTNAQDDDINKNYYKNQRDYYWNKYINTKNNYESTSNTLNNLKSELDVLL